MQASEMMSDLHYLLEPNVFHLQFPCDSSGLTAAHRSQTISNPLHQLYASSQQWPESSPNSTTSDEAEVSIINERKQRRMISNRESARRSRMRKQRHLDELWSQVVRLQNENRQLIEKLNASSEDNDRLLEENSQLKEEAADLRQMLPHMHLNHLIRSHLPRFD